MTPEPSPTGTPAVTESIDILLPYYGDVGLMQQAVNSVLAQDDPVWTLYVVDDGYPDPAVRRWFEAMTDDRVHYFRNETNLGANGNYRRSLELATSDYLVVMGADDIMQPDYVTSVRSIIARHPGIAVVQPGVRVIDGRGEPASPLADRIKRSMSPVTEQHIELSGEQMAASLLKANWTYFPSLCWRRETVQAIGFREGLNVVQDLALLFDVAKSGGSIVVDPSVVFLYRRHGVSDSAVRAVDGSRFDEERAFFRQVAAECRDRGWPRAERAARWHLTSRLNAASLLPVNLKARRMDAVKTLLRHVIS